MTNRRYVIVSLATAALLIAAASVFNVLVDPYTIFGSPRIDGFNSQKPFAGDRGRIAKVHQVMRLQPRTIIVGNSRPEIGLDPGNSCWPESAKPVFNLALPGLTVYGQVRVAQHAIAAAPVSDILMGVDFLDYLESGDRGIPPHWPSSQESGLRLTVDPFGQPRAAFRLDRMIDWFRAGVSLDAVSDSVVTIAQQKRRWVETRTVLGLHPGDETFAPIVRREGTRVLFLQKDRDLAMQLAPPQTLFDAGKEWSAEFEALERLVRQSREQNIGLILFINPYHAEYLLVLEAAGLWPLFEQWKARVAHIAAAHGVTLWDFSLFDAYATESVDDLSDKAATLRWFWEPAHYRQELGDIMLSRMLGAHCSANADMQFGIVLDDQALQREAADVRARRDRFKLQHPAVAERIDQLVRDARSGRLR